MHGGLKHLYALEKNHDSVQYLTANISLNNIRSLVTIIEGDNRAETIDTAPLVGACDRVLMGYIPSCSIFLPRAVQFLRLRENGTPCGVLHYHCLAESDTHVVEVVHNDVEVNIPQYAQSYRVLQKRAVKSYSPKKYHYVVDMEF